MSTTILHPMNPPVPSALPNSLIALEHDTENAALWCTLTDVAPPFLSPELLGEFEAADRQSCEIIAATANPACASAPIKYRILTSELPGIFNLGGDLTLFRKLILQGDRTALSAYAQRCLELILSATAVKQLDITTITVLAGRAIGGGLEAALTSDWIVAEEGVEVGFPEITFNLWPGMGAWQLLNRRVHPRTARDIILGGKLYSAEEACELGLIDRVVPVGEGANAVRSFMASNRHQHAGFRSFNKAVSAITALDSAECQSMLNDWIDQALCLSARDLRVMEYMTRQQSRLLAQNEEDERLVHRIAQAG